MSESDSALYAANQLNSKIRTDSALNNMLRSLMGEKQKATVSQRLKELFEVDDILAKQDAPINTVYDAKQQAMDNQIAMSLSSPLPQYEALDSNQENLSTAMINTNAPNTRVERSMNGGLMAFSPQARMQQGLMQTYRPPIRMNEGGIFNFDDGPLNPSDVQLRSKIESRRRKIGQGLDPKNRNDFYKFFQTLKTDEEKINFLGGDSVNLGQEFFQEIEKNKFDLGDLLFTSKNAQDIQDATKEIFEDKSDDASTVVPSGGKTRTALNLKGLEGVGTDGPDASKPDSGTVVPEDKSDDVSTVVPEDKSDDGPVDKPIELVEGTEEDLAGLGGTSVDKLEYFKNLYTKTDEASKGKGLSSFLGNLDREDLFSMAQGMLGAKTLTEGVASSLGSYLKTQEGKKKLASEAKKLQLSADDLELRRQQTKQLGKYREDTISERERDRESAEEIAEKKLKSQKQIADKRNITAVAVAKLNSINKPDLLTNASIENIEKNVIKRYPHFYGGSEKWEEYVKKNPDAFPKSQFPSGPPEYGKKEFYELQREIVENVTNEFVNTFSISRPNISPGGAVPTVNDSGEVVSLQNTP
tara:strand:+ start:4401 stop:6152 length:1752 start_codon:yes stop_codon:yes gene_type:complete